MIDWLIRQQWFYSSPGPISLIYYGILILIGMRYLLKKVPYKPGLRRYTTAFADSFFITGFIVLSGDFLWMFACALRFLPLFPHELNLVIYVLLRDALGMFFCFLTVQTHFYNRVISFKKSTCIAYLIFVIFLILDFGLAPDPSWTDWTYGIRYGASTQTILLSLIFSYGIGKIVAFIIWWTWWNDFRCWMRR